LKLIPTVPNFAALELCGAPSKTGARHVIWKPSNPAASTIASSSPSRRAPAIQPVHSSTFRFAASETGLCTSRELERTESVSHQNRLETESLGEGNGDLQIACAWCRHRQESAIWIMAERVVVEDSGEAPACGDLGLDPLQRLVRLGNDGVVVRRDVDLVQKASPSVGAAPDEQEKRDKGHDSCRLCTHRPQPGA
jgi:hypothetical protein